jgi:hypothetical protein
MKVGITLLKLWRLFFGNRSFLTEIDGDLWIAANATYDGTNWNRVDTTKYAFAIQIQGYGNIPGESTPGVNIWKAAAGENPIGDFLEEGGWETLAIGTAYSSLVIGGSTVEVDGSGATAGYSRLICLNDGLHLTHNAYWDGANWNADVLNAESIDLWLDTSGNVSLRIAYVTANPISWSYGDLIADGSVTTDKLADYAVTADKLAANAVETAKIKDLAVSTGKIADNAVTGAKIAEGAVGTWQLISFIKYTRAKAYRSTDQSYTHETFTKVQFNTEVFDLNNGYDNATNYRYTVGSGCGGQYVVHAKVRISSTATAAEKLIEVWVNNMLVSKGLFHSTGVTGDFDGEITTVLNLAAGDYVEIFIYDPSDGTIVAGSDQTYFEIFRLP